MAIFGVIVIHIAAPMYYMYNKLPMDYWGYANLYGSLARSCVPLFFMLSGYLLLGKQEELPSFFSKRVNKVLIPLFAWSVIFVFWNVYVQGMTNINILDSLAKSLLTPVYYHLWFMYAIIGVYLFVPILRAFLKNSSDNLVKYYLCVWFVAVSLIPAVETFSGIESKIDLLSISGYAGYLVLGYWLGTINVDSRLAKLSGIVFLVTVIITAAGNFQLTQLQGKLSEYFFGYLSPNVILMSAAAFILLKYVFSRYEQMVSDKVANVIRSISAASLGIYFIHVMFIFLLNKGSLGIIVNGVVMNGTPMPAAISILLGSAVVFLLSYFSVMVLRYIPVVKKTMP